MMLSDREVLIHDGNYRRFVRSARPQVSGEKVGFGLSPPTRQARTAGMRGVRKTTAVRFPRSEWPERIRDMVASKSRLSDVRNRGMGGARIPSRDQDGKGYCFLPGQMVTMSNYGTQLIEKIKPGDSVVTAEGRSCVVTETMSRLVSEPVLKLYMADGASVTLTGEHPVLTKIHSYLPAWTLKPGTEVSYGQSVRTWAPVKAVERVPYAGPVYNLEVEGDHSYVVHGLGVHNCWAHSTVSCAMLGRAKDGQPYADLSAYAIACIIKGFRDQGGWNGESMKFLRERGCPTSEFWPQQSMSRSNDNPNTWANAALHKMTEWEEISEGDFDTQMSSLMVGLPHALDLNWWSHSIAAADPVDGTSAFNKGQMRSRGKRMSVRSFERVWGVADFGAAFGIRIWNSWGDSWSDGGMGVLTESKARNNGAIILRSTLPSVN